MLKKNPPASRNCAITEGLRSKPHAQYRARCVHSDGLCLRRVVGKVLDLQSGEAGKHRARCSSMSRIDGRIQFNPAESSRRSGWHAVKGRKPFYTEILEQIPNTNLKSAYFFARTGPMPSARRCRDTMPGHSAVSCSVLLDGAPTYDLNRAAVR
jgi:hypothetical protein